MINRRDALWWAGTSAGAVLPLSTAAVTRITGPTVSGLQELSVTDVAPDTPVFLSERSRQGWFVSVAGPAPGGDPAQGLFVATPRPDRHFARVWDGVNGRPEWFGAVTNDGQSDCAAAIEACFAACPVTRLAQADYFVRRTIVLDRSWRTMIGVGRFAADQDQGTRIILQGRAAGIHTDDMLLVGSTRPAGPTSDRFPQEIHLSDFTLVRDGASAPHPSGDLRRYPAGLRASFLVRSSLSGIASLESSVGFYFGGLVYVKVDDCLAQRIGAGQRTGPDLAAGFLLDGSPEIGLAGGNASLYLRRCLAVGQHPAHVMPTGLIAQGAFVDSFVDQFESARIDNGIRVSAQSAVRASQLIDLHLRNCVLDGCGGTALGIDLAGMQGASIEIVDPYVYSAGGGGARGLSISNGGGLVTITGGQVHGDFREGSLLLDRMRGVRVQGLKLHEGSRPVVVRDSGASQLEPQICNLSRRAAGFAIEAERVYRTAFKPIVIGAPSMFAGGIALDATSNYSSVDTTAVDPGCFATVTDARKLWFGGVDAARAGLSAFERRGNVSLGVRG